MASMKLLFLVAILVVAAVGIPGATAQVINFEFYGDAAAGGTGEGVGAGAQGGGGAVSVGAGGTVDVGGGVNGVVQPHT